MAPLMHGPPNLQAHPAHRNTVPACLQVSFEVLAGKALRQMLQVGKTLCEGRGARTPDRLFVLLNMHKSLVVRRRRRAGGRAGWCMHTPHSPVAMHSSAKATALAVCLI